MIGCIHQPDAARCPVCNDTDLRSATPPVAKPSPRRLIPLEVALVASGVVIGSSHAPALDGLAELVVAIAALDIIRRMLLRLGSRL
jgi:hypothetical protein